MPSPRVEPSRDLIPDPAALAQGQRMLRIASGLEIVAWLCGMATLVLFSLAFLLVDRLDEEFAITVALTFALAWLLWAGARTPSMRATPYRGPRLPGEIHDLLAIVDNLIDTLERGQDRRFQVDATELGVALDGLGPEGSRYLDERGADRARLRHGVCWFNSKLSADRRRALHHELTRFGAAARGRPCGDPYRSRTSDGPLLLTVVREPALARTRRRCAGLLLSVGMIWAAVSSGLSAMRLRMPRFCNPWGDSPTCELAPPIELELARELLEDGLQHLDRGETITIAIALVPMFLLLIAQLWRDAAWQSFAAALPEADELPAAAAGRLARVRRRERVLHLLWRGFAWLACGVTASVVVTAPNWGLRVTIAEQVFTIAVVTLALVVLPTVVAQLESRRERWRLWRRSARAPRSAALLAELSELRRELEHAAPVRADLLEQLADALAQADVLGRLSPQDRDRVVVRLRAGAARGPALAHEQRDRLLLDVHACEASIGAGGR